MTKKKTLNSVFFIYILNYLTFVAPKYGVEFPKSG